MVCYNIRHQHREFKLYDRTVEGSCSPFYVGSFLIAAVLGPPDVTVSGCGNCLLLQLKVPTARGREQLKDLYGELVLTVRRTRDGAQVTK